MLQIISKVLNPSNGNINVNGKVAALLELGAGFNPEFTGIENIYFNGQIMGFSKKEIDAKREEIIAFTDIGDFINQPVKTYSSGMFVRLAFALAINVYPDILLIDEALAVGDAAFQVKCINKIKEFVNSNKTLIFVSHDPAAVKILCERVILLDQGKIIDTGSPDKVFDYFNYLIGLSSDSSTNIQEKVKFRKRSGNKKIEIKSVSILNKENIKTDSIISGENVTIEIKAKANKTIQNPTFGIAIKDRFGNDVFSINNYLLKTTSGDFIKDNIYRITYSLPMNLGINIYSLAVASHSGQTHCDENYDWINEAVIFKVIPSNDFTFLGYCRIKPKFHINVI